MTLVGAPFERLKILLLQGQGQNIQGNKHYKKARSGTTTMLRRLYKNGGIRSVYRGSLMTFVRDALDSAAYFATYECCKQAIHSQTRPWHLRLFEFVHGHRRWRECRDGDVDTVIPNSTVQEQLTGC